MNAVVALGMGRSVAAASLALLLCAAALEARAGADPFDETVLAQAYLPAAGRGPQMEMSTASQPRFDSSDSAAASSRIDVTLLPTPGSALGPSLAITRPQARGFPGDRPYSGSLTTVDLGLHWRYTMLGNYRFDVVAWRRMNPVEATSLIENRESSYGARVEMHLTSVPRSGFVADHGFLGFQLESGARITLRRSGGKPMLYYRTKF